MEVYYPFPVYYITIFPAARILKVLQVDTLRACKYKLQAGFGKTERNILQISSMIGNMNVFFCDCFSRQAFLTAQQRPIHH